VIVYLLWHVHDLENDADEKVIGVYASQANAEAARERAKSLPGFRDYPDGFHIDGYELDEGQWREGFVTTAA
jgi:homoserine kinase type II